ASSSPSSAARLRDLQQKSEDQRPPWAPSLGERGHRRLPSRVLSFRILGRRTVQMRRRDFVGWVGCAAAWPLAARAQQPQRMRRIGALMSSVADDPNALDRMTVFAQELQQLGWSIGRNVQIDYRWGASNPNEARRYAMELAALAPDVILARSSQSVAALQS